ncbi:MAG TPA: PTS fructose transporter subunit IIA [Rubrivivax sp.]|nr:PTS fructose transporter subunit IIA [Rubrivivax sp.]
MPSILIVAHAPLASSLLAVARHAFADCGRQVAAVDVPAAASLEDAQQQIEAALAGLSQQEVLVLVDAFGATPSNAALNVASAAGEGSRRRVVTGVNVPMLWRILCYGHLPLDELVTRAVDGGRHGILQVANPRPQNQFNPPAPSTADGPDSNPDQ